MYGIYYGGAVMLAQVEKLRSYAYLSPSIPFSILFLFLFIMVIISASMTAFGSFYLARDLDLLLSSPISFFQFFAGKFSRVLINSSWMSIIFILPAVVAFAVQFRVSITQSILLSLALSIPFFVIAASVAVIASTIIASIIPAGRTRELVFFVVLLFLYVLYKFITLISFGFSERNNADELLRVLWVLSLPNKLWLPSHWIAISLREFFEGNPTAILPGAVTLVSTALAFFSCAFLITRTFHGYAFTKAGNNMHGSHTSALWMQSITSRLLPEKFFHWRALVLKEYRLCFREITQIVQIILLLGVYIIYLYNVRAFRFGFALHSESAHAWQALFFIINIAMCAFITIAICTRFVYPSLSLEGRSFWLLKASPHSLHDILTIKFWTWLIPVGFLSSLVYAGGAAVVKASLQWVILNAILGWIISYGLVGVAIGIGVIFANFEWEHLSELAASFGGLVYMLIGVSVVTLSALPIGLALFLDIQFKIQPEYHYLVTSLKIACATLVLLFNIAVGKRFLTLGESFFHRRLDA